MDPDEDDEIVGEVEISFIPRPEALAAFGIAPDEFKAALGAALEEREDRAAGYDGDDDEFPPMNEMPLRIGGVSYKLDELADVVIRSGDT
jgi:hypothetical protein